ncbi:MAG: type III pantothenate kinase [Candidatus Omnitrophota bacterium]
MITIAVDIGNTNVTVGFLKGLRVCDVFRVPTALLRDVKKAASVFRQKSGPVFKKPQAARVLACSVVPDLNKNLKQVCRQAFGIDARMAGVDFSVPILNEYRIPSQVGQDRLVNAYAGLKLYGKGLIIVDFGTAITFDVVSRTGEYLGGLIVPGLRLMQEGLNKKTALLPFVELARPIELVGRDTASSIRAGVIFGAAGLCDGILSRLLAKECRSYKVIVTGGDALLVKPFTKFFKTIEENLILKGLSLIAESHSVAMKKPY